MRPTGSRKKQERRLRGKRRKLTSWPQRRKGELRKKPRRLQKPRLKLMLRPPARRRLPTNCRMQRKSFSRKLSKTDRTRKLTRKPPKHKLQLNRPKMLPTKQQQKPKQPKRPKKRRKQSERRPRKGSLRRLWQG